MSREFPKAQRPSEDLVLDFTSKRRVKGEIVQYLSSHQINGLRFLYTNYKNNKSCFLNDEHGLGKMFQLVAFLSTVCDETTDNGRILILCQNANKLLHWDYHCAVLLPRVKTIIADNEQPNAEVDPNRSTSCIVLTSVDNALRHAKELEKIKYRFVILHDEHLEVNFDALVAMRTIIGSKVRKVIVSSDDVLMNTQCFYQMLKFCDLRLPLFIKETKQFLDFNEFNMKFGGANNVSKRNAIFRQKNLLNICSDFYLRRFRRQFEGILPLLDKAVYDKCFTQWKTSRFRADSSSLDSSWFEDDMEIPSLQEVVDVVCAEDAIDLNASIHRDGYESQMSPLVYHSSESDEDDIGGAQSSLGTLGEGVSSKGNKQKSGSQKKPRNMDESEATTRTLRSQNKKRTLRSSGTRKFPSSSSEIEPKANKKDNRRQQKGKRIDKLASSAESSSNSPLMTQATTKTTTRAHGTRKSLTWSQDTSTSDVQLVEAEGMTPILISSSSNTPVVVPNQTNTDSRMSEPSPDIFGSFTEHSGEISNSTPGSSPTPAGQSEFANVQNGIDGSETICTQDIFADSQDDVDKTNPVEALSTTTSDIFEITRNNIFHNVLRVNNDESVTPVVPRTGAASIKSCFSGVRVVLPRLKSNEILELQRGGKAITNATKGSSEELIDLTAESQSIEVSSSNDAVIIADSEKTPEQKRSLTPSTRSCVRRSSTERDEVPHTPTRSGWLSKRSNGSVSPHGTPRSRRRLDKWFPSLADQHSNRSSTSAQCVLQPRNIFEKKRSETTRPGTATTSLLDSPSIFSSDDE